MPETIEEYRARIGKLTLAEARTELTARRDEIVALADKKPEEVTQEEEARFDPAMAEFDVVKAATAALEERERKLDEVRATTTGTAPGNGGPQVITRPDDLFGGDTRKMPRRELRDRALRVLEDRGRFLSSVERDNVDRLVRSNMGAGGTPGCDGAIIAERLLLTETDDYRSGFQKGVTDPQPIFTPEEARAVNAFREFERRTETRAASEGTVSAGGFGIPVLIDPTIILSSGAIDAPILSLARMVTITTDAWKGVTAPGASWSYVAEAGVVTDGTPTLSQPVITVYKASGFIPYSIELGQDYPGWADEVSMLMNQGYIDLIATQSMTGSGSSSPFGIFTTMSNNTVSPAHVTVTTAGTLGAVDIRAAWGKMPERFRPRSTWVMNIGVENVIRAFGNNLAMSDYTVNLAADGTAVMTGRPVVITDYAPAFPSTTGQANYCVVGDFSQFLIVQRAGMTVELVQHLFDTSTGRPTGQRGWYAYTRHGFDAVNKNAFRILTNT